MGKKTKSKQRLDTYYHYAKSQGYRSRAAYKLIQLNRKYNFLNNANIVIDLCAAPGGWMQVAKEFMPMNSTVIGVDLDPIKKVPGAQSFQGDITTNLCYQTLRKMIHGQKCDAVLNDGAPNVGANWSKDAYTQSQLVLHALKLACSFLKEGGFFITKVFRSTDFQSLMWVFKKFFEKVQATKPKASRFVSAQIFVVCFGYLAPQFIDEKLFDAKYIFKDTEADHYHEQMAGQITSIDKLLQPHRKRGGYQDDAPMHLYKQTSLTHFMNSHNPLLIFAEFNRITVSQQERATYYSIVKKMPEDLDQMLADLKVLGKREVSNLLKWRGKIKNFSDVKQKKVKNQRKMSESQNISMEQENLDSSDQLQMQILNQNKKQIRALRQKQQKKQQIILKAKILNEQHNHDQQLGSDFQDILDEDIQIEKLGYDQPEIQQKKVSKGRKVVDFNQKQLQENLEQFYETKRAIISEKQQHARDVRQQKKKRKQDRYQTKSDKLKSRRFGPNDVEENQNQQEELQEQEEQHADLEAIKFKNPLADLDDDDLYLSDNQEQGPNYDNIDPDQKMEGELSDDEAYVIPKPVSDMEKRRKQIKKNQKKKENKLKKDVINGQDLGGQIQIVKQKTMDDYDIDSLAETLAIAKKMLRNKPRQEIVENSYRGFSFEDHDQLPKWFADDQKKHNYKKPPITKEQYNQEKQRLMAINARIPKKIMEAKVRRKIRMQKKLKKVQKKAEVVMNQEGINQISKLRQVGKLYDKEKRALKDKKKYIVGSRSKAVGGKDSRNVKHVDSRLKKDKRSQKIRKSKHVNRKHKRRGKF